MFGFLPRLWGYKVHPVDGHPFAASRLPAMQFRHSSRMHRPRAGTFGARDLSALPPIRQGHTWHEPASITPGCPGRAEQRRTSASLPPVQSRQNARIALDGARTGSLMTMVSFRHSFVISVCTSVVVLAHAALTTSASALPLHTIGGLHLHISQHSHHDSRHRSCGRGLLCHTVWRIQCPQRRQYFVFFRVIGSNTF